MEPNTRFLSTPLLRVYLFFCLPHWVYTDLAQPELKDLHELVGTLNVWVSINTPINRRVWGSRSPFPGSGYANVRRSFVWYHPFLLVDTPLTVFLIVIGILVLFVWFPGPGPKLLEEGCYCLLITVPSYFYPRLTSRGVSFPYYPICLFTDAPFDYLLLLGEHDIPIPLLPVPHRCPRKWLISVPGSLGSVGTSCRTYPPCRTLVLSWCCVFPSSWWNEGRTSMRVSLSPSTPNTCCKDLMTSHFRRTRVCYFHPFHF